MGEGVSGSPVVTTLPSNAGGTDLISDLGTEIPHAMECSREKKKEREISHETERKQTVDFACVCRSRLVNNLISTSNTYQSLRQTHLIFNLNLIFRTLRRKYYHDYFTNK